MSEISRKKVILAITKSNFGGAQRYVYDLATSMPKEDFDVTVIFGDGEELETKLTQAGIKTIKIKSLQRNVNPFKDIFAFFRLIKILRKEKPDVLHLNSTKIGGIGVLAGRLCRIPKIIFTAHGWAFNEKRNLFSKLFIALLQWITVKSTHFTIAVSQKTAEQILKFPLIKKNKIKVIYNGISNIDFLTQDEARRALLSSGTASELSQKINQFIWIGTISELHKNKGLDVALTALAEIIKKYPQTIFVVIGGGEEDIHLKKQILKLGLSNHAFLIGAVPDAKKYLKAFNIFTLTSRTEALPYVILEAGLAELPVIASAVGGIPEIINLPDVGLLVPTGKKAVSEITNTIEKLLTNPEYAKTIGQNLKNRITQEFSPEKMRNETFSLYKN